MFKVGDTGRSNKKHAYVITYVGDEIVVAKMTTESGIQFEAAFNRSDGVSILSEATGKDDRFILGPPVLKRTVWVALKLMKEGAPPYPTEIYDYDPRTSVNMPPYKGPLAAIKEIEIEYQPGEGLEKT